MESKSNEEHLNPMLNRSYQKRDVGKHYTLSNNKGSKRPSRKKRKDAKQDVKIPLNPYQKKTVRYIAYKNKVSQEFLCGEIMKKALKEDINYPSVKYKTSEKMVRARMEEKYYTILLDYAIEWDCSIRQAAHRIFTYHIDRWKVNQS